MEKLLKLAIFISALYEVHANWMYLGLSSVGVVPVPDSCGRIPGLVQPQLEVCQNNPEALPCVSEGARRGIIECKNQFKFERWNCTTNSRNSSVFGPVLHQGTRETAFIYAITSAGVVHAVTQSCSAGNLTDCACDVSKAGLPTPEGWTWGGCSDNIKYGMQFGKKFVDAPERYRRNLGTTRERVRIMMNLHNNEAGRKIIQAGMKTECRCHGVSGSCAIKTCWKVMPTFSEVGALLKDKYEKSVEIAPRAKRKLRRRERQRRRVPIKDTEIVHIAASPNYCRANSKNGILGTKGRECNKRSRGADSCNLLCCGRGYNTETIFNKSHVCSLELFGHGLVNLKHTT
ncbi:unnamed protein product [Owenia fusiformis]|uniref:Protein Wnt n=1 Tax=Owenia fusiformis TaxID=6347 RepID=A0A8S4NMU2_OWEFU|nr:unnamed protein product [Owenia fusiformis]